MKPLSNNQRGASASISFRLDTENTRAIYAILDDTPKSVSISSVLRAFVASGLEQFEANKGHPDIVELREARDNYTKDRAKKLGAIPQAEADAMKARIEELERQLHTSTGSGKAKSGRRRKSQ